MLIKGIQTQGVSSGEDVGKLVNSKKTKTNLRKKAKAMLGAFDEEHGTTDSDVMKTYGFDPYPPDIYTKD